MEQTVEQTIEDLKKQFEGEISLAQNTKTLNDVKVRYLGKKGPVQQLMKRLGEVPPQQRPLMGKLINELKTEFEEKCDRALDRLTQIEDSHQLLQEKIDVTLPGRRRYAGRKHPVTQMMDKVIEVMSGMGFTVQYGPDIDSDYYNFEALNFAKDHPARDMQDTFYITPDVLLRTHTSNIQIRVMEAHQPPIRIIAPGKCYRNEEITARSHVFFHQVEAVCVDKGVTFADLLETLDEFLKRLFHPDIKVRYRPSYFPFTEPSVEVDISCIACEGKGCPLCKHTGWLEILGAGMIHPEVLKNGGIDPEEYTGYAWGMGIERLVMLHHRIKDIRLFTENDLRFLDQF